MSKKTENKNKKTLILLLLLIAIVLLVGSVISFFSDVITGTAATVTAGTLDIQGTYEYYINNEGDPVTSVPNFNPGDVIVVKATITNAGNKSAWVRNVIDFNNIDAAIAKYIKIYEGEGTTGSLLATLSGSVKSYTSASKIMNGKLGSSGAENETGTDALLSDTMTVTYTIYFDSAALNEAQGLSAGFTAKTEAIQYRNNSGTADWNDLTNTPVI